MDANPFPGTRSNAFLLLLSVAIEVESTEPVPPHFDQAVRPTTTHPDCRRRIAPQSPPRRVESAIESTFPKAVYKKTLTLHNILDTTLKLGQHTGKYVENG